MTSGLQDAAAIGCGFRRPVVNSLLPGLATGSHKINRRTKMK
jgi:hypothetical protein